MTGPRSQGYGGRARLRAPVSLLAQGSASWLHSAKRGALSPRRSLCSRDKARPACLLVSLVGETDGPGPGRHPSREADRAARGGGIHAEATESGCSGLQSWLPGS